MIVEDREIYPFRVLIILKKIRFSSPGLQRLAYWLTFSDSTWSGNSKNIIQTTFAGAFQFQMLRYPLGPLCYVVPKFSRRAGIPWRYFTYVGSKWGLRDQSPKSHLIFFLWQSFIEYLFVMHSITYNFRGVFFWEMITTWLHTFRICRKYF